MKTILHHLSSLYVERVMSLKEVYKVWKIVYNGIALPLLIDLRAKAGLPSPLCFMRPPSELQMKILEFLPGVDIAKVGCVCKAGMRRRRLPHYGWPLYSPIRRDPNPLEVPRIIGGDYDHLPDLVSLPLRKARSTSSSSEVLFTLLQFGRILW